LNCKIPYKEIIYDRVAYVPEGKVVTYGQLAEGLPGITSRMAGFALSKTPENIDIPWHRVVNSRGKISIRGDGDNEQIQQKLLEQEGIVFNHLGIINLKQYKWQPTWQSIGVFSENREKNNVKTGKNISVSRRGR